MLNALNSCNLSLTHCSMFLLCLSRFFSIFFCIEYILFSKRKREKEIITRFLFWCCCCYVFVMFCFVLLFFFQNCCSNVIPCLFTPDWRANEPLPSTEFKKTKLYRSFSVFFFKKKIWLCRRANGQQQKLTSV